MLELLGPEININTWNEICDLIDLGVLIEREDLIPEGKLKEGQAFESVIEENGNLYLVSGWSEVSFQEDYVTIEKFKEKD